MSVSFSSSSAIVVRSSGNTFFDRLPEDAIKSIFEFLKSYRSTDDRVIISVSAEVCRNWQANPTLTEESEEASNRNGYPIQVFRNCHKPISQLPVLDLGDRMGRTDYIDFIQPTDMPQSVMRFRDCQGRPGIALKIQARRRLILRDQLDQFRNHAATARDGLRAGNLQKFCWYAQEATEIVKRFFIEGGPTGVLAFFKREADPKSAQWKVGCDSDGDTIEQLYKERHQRNGHVGAKYCPNCPFIGHVMNTSVMNTKLYSALLNGKDPDFFLPRHTEISPKTIVAVSLAVLAIAYLLNYCLMSQRS